MARFVRFKEGGLAKIATSLGYTGDMSGFQDYLNKNPMLKDRMKQLEDSAVEMASKTKYSDYQQRQEQPKDTIGQFVPPPKQTFETTKMATGGVLPQAYVPTLGTGTGQVDAYKKGQNVADVTAAQAQTGAMPVGAVTQATRIKAEDNQMITEGTGALGTQAPATQTKTADTAQATAAQPPIGIAKVDAAETTDKVNAALTASQAAEGTVRPESKVLAA